MSTLELHYARSGNSLRAVIALEEMGFPFARHPVDLSGGETRTEAFLGLNPMGAVPVLIDNGAVTDGKPLILAQSGAIMLHLSARKGDRLIPSDPARRALSLQWFMAAISDVGVQNTLHRYLDMKAPERSEANQLWLRNRLLDSLDAFQSALRDTAYLDSPEATIADLALFPVVHIRRKQLDASGRFSLLLAWYERMASRPAVVRACTHAGPPALD